MDNLNQKEINDCIDIAVFSYLQLAHKYNNLFSAVVINKYKYKYFFDNHLDICENGVIDSKTWQFKDDTEIARLTYDNRFLLDIPWQHTDYLSEQEKRLVRTNPYHSEKSEKLWADFGRNEIKKIANDFKNFCIENQLYSND